MLSYHYFENIGEDLVDTATEAARTKYVRSYVQHISNRNSDADEESILAAAEDSWCKLSTPLMVKRIQRQIDKLIK